MEEWNEYGELQGQLGSAPPPTVTPSASLSNTPSKAPTTTSGTLSTSTPSKNPPAVSFAENIPPKQAQATGTSIKPPAGGVETSFSLAMRQAGKEAAEKAKLKPKSSASKPSAPSDAPLAKLDNSAPSGVPPPSGITDTASAKAPDNGSADVASKADAVPATGDVESTDKAVDDTTSLPAGNALQTAGLPESKSVGVIDSALGDLKPTESTDSVATSMTDTTVASTRGIMKHRGSSISAASKDAIKEVEEAMKIEEEPEEEELATKSHKAEAKIKESGSVAKATDQKNDTGTNEAKIVLPQGGTPEGQEESAKQSGDGDLASRKAQEIPEEQSLTKAQEQDAADPAKASESVAD